MNKELLFLKNIKGLGNSKINKKFIDTLNESENYIDLISHDNISSFVVSENRTEFSVKSKSINKTRKFICMKRF